MQFRKFSAHVIGRALVASVIFAGVGFLSFDALGQAPGPITDSQLTLANPSNCLLQVYAVAEPGRQALLLSQVAANDQRTISLPKGSYTLALQRSQCAINADFALHIMASGIAMSLNGVLTTDHISDILRLDL